MGMLGIDDLATVQQLAAAVADKVTSTQLTEGLAGKSNTGHGHSISDVSGLQNELDGKVSVQTAATGTLITFTAQKVFGSFTTPETANIDNDLTGAKSGIVQKIYHNNSVAPTLPAGWVKLGSGSYVTGSLNVIFCEWVGGTRVEYWVTQ